MPEIALPGLLRLPKETRDQLSAASRRNRRIPPLLENDGEGLHIMRDPQMTQKLQTGFGWVVEGIDIDSTSVNNLHQADRISQQAQLMVATPHDDDLDHFYKRKVLEYVGMEDFADRLVYPAGIKMKERWWVNMFMGGEESVYVPTPFDRRKAKKALGDKKLTKRERARLQSYWELIDRWERIGGAILRRRAEEGQIIALYPESTRSRGIYLGRAPREVGTYFKDTDKNKFVLPIVINGAKETRYIQQLPVPQKRARFRVIVREPIPAYELWNYDKTIQLGDERTSPADVVMGTFALMDPPRVKPADFQFYQRLLRSTNLRAA